MILSNSTPQMQASIPPVSIQKPVVGRFVSIIKPIPLKALIPPPIYRTNAMIETGIDIFMLYLHNFPGRLVAAPESEYYLKNAYSIPITRPSPMNTARKPKPLKKKSYNTPLGFSQA